MSTFEIRPVERFAGSNAAIRRPKEIAYFSYDDAHVFHLDDRSLRYYYPPRLSADLSKGFDTFQQLDDTTDDHLDSLLSTIMDLERQSGVKCEADIITWRGMMTKIMASPFDNMNGFEMNATSFQLTSLPGQGNNVGNIASTVVNGQPLTIFSFIEENHEQKLLQRQSQHSQPSRPGAPSQDLMSYFGYKFETLSLMPDMWDPTPRDYIENREELIVNNHAQYCSVVRTGIGKAKMILGGEVDALWDCKPENKDEPINWVELKTSVEFENERDMVKYERKLLKFWIQSFLLGVPKIIVGFRSRDGILQRLEELETKAIPGIVKRRGKGSWDGNVCINFTASFLDWLKQTVTGDGVWKIRRRERSSTIEVFKQEETGHGDILSQQFLAWRKQRVVNGDKEQERA